jgi:hypothetical protein
VTVRVGVTGPSGRPLAVDEEREQESVDLIAQVGRKHAMTRRPQRLGLRPPHTAIRDSRVKQQNGTEALVANPLLTHRVNLTMPTPVRQERRSLIKRGDTRERGRATSRGQHGLRK